MGDKKKKKTCTTKLNDNLKIKKTTTKQCLISNDTDNITFYNAELSILPYILALIVR